jgi:hypothetical protein
MDPPSGLPMVVYQAPAVHAVSDGVCSLNCPAGRMLGVVRRPRVREMLHQSEPIGFRKAARRLCRPDSALLNGEQSERNARSIGREIAAAAGAACRGQ